MALLVGGDRAHAAKPTASEDPGFSQLEAVARSIPIYSLEPLDAEVISGLMADILRGLEANSREAIVACEANHGEGERRPDWVQRLRLTWNCVQRARPNEDGADLADLTIRAALLRLDPEATYYSGAEELQANLGPPTRETAGIGISLMRLEGGGLEVVSVEPNRPAADAGIRRGDLLVAIEGRQLADTALDDVIRQLRGAPGSTIGVTFQPRGQNDTVHRELRRALLSPSEPTLMRREEILIVGIASMGNNTEDALARNIRAALAETTSAILLDLRGSPGGRLDVAVAIADLFLDRGQVLTVIERQGSPQQFRARRGDIASRMPLYVLVDRTTASGAEAVAAALADRGRARILGQRTMGRGGIRSMTLLPAPGRGAISVTSGRMIRPNGEPISAGVNPTVTISADGDGEDPMLERAVQTMRLELAHHGTIGE